VGEGGKPLQGVKIWFFLFFKFLKKFKLFEILIKFFIKLFKIFEHFLKFPHLDLQFLTKRSLLQTKRQLTKA
jgi:hypothetical protein